MVYNNTYMDNATNPLDLMVGIGQSIGNQFLLGNLILLSFFMLFLILSYKHNFLEILIIDSFICIILSVLLFTAGLIQAPIISIPVVIFILGLVFYLMT